MSFTWDAKTQARIDKQRRKSSIIGAIGAVLMIAVVLAIVVGIRFAIIGFEYNECFWAQDVGTCLALRNK